MQPVKVTSEVLLRRALWTTSVLLICGIAWLTWVQSTRMLQSVRFAFADDQTQIFAEMRAKALQNGPDEALDCLQYVVGYYPTGTRQVTGSQLDKLVERSRSEAIKAIIDHLRCITGKDFGDDPNTAWKYARAATEDVDDRAEPLP